MLFAATSVIWGSSFLFVRVAVAHMAPSVVVTCRCVLGALFLVPLAARSGALARLRRNMIPIGRPGTYKRAAGAPKRAGSPA
jgi:drug/metabolite transporter (DMT)-like permease